MTGSGKNIVKRLFSVTGLLWLCIASFGCGKSGCLIATFLLRSPAAQQMSRMMGSSDPRASTGALSSVPALKFTGNATTMAPPTDANGNVDGIGMVRQLDCSMTEYFLTNYNAATGSFSSTAVANYQNYLHSAAQLTSTPNVFKNGCSQTMIGASATSAVFAGKTKSGAIIGAGLDYNNHFYTGYLDVVAGTSSYVTVNSIIAAVAVTVGDLNGDGNQDLMVGDFGGNGGVGGALVVMLGNGDGTFATPVRYPLTSGAGALVIDDFNNDKKLDVLIASNSGISFFPGKGDGTLGTAITLPGSTYSGQMASGDLNGDGNKDFVTSTGLTFLGAGDGTFKAGPAIAASLSGNPVLGDFNNDGKLDVAFATPGGRGVSISLGKGDGTFTVGKAYASIYGSQNMSAIDIDGDGNLDLVVGEGNSGALGPDLNTGGLYEVLMGNGDGTFQGASLYPQTSVTGLDDYANAFAVGDFNGDGKTDILTAVGTTGLGVLVGDGKGHFTAGTTTIGPKPVVIAAALMNGDAKLDAVFIDSEYAPSVGVAFGNGDGTFGATKDYPIPVTSTAFDVSLTTGDFNGDGFPDVVVTTQLVGSPTNSAAYLFLNDGAGGLKPGTLIDTGIAQDALVVADLNGDKKMDLIIADAGSFQGLGGPVGAVKVYMGKGDGTFQAPVLYQPGADIGQIYLADINKDGIPDLLISSSDNSGSNAYLNVLPGKANGTFGTAIQTAESGNFASGFAVTDFDGDGNPDVLQGGCCGQAFATIFFGKGDGTFSSNFALANAVSVTTVAAVDLNGDGRPDVIVNPNGGGAGLEVFMNLYSTVGTIGTTTTLTVQPNPVTVAKPLTLTAVVATSGYGTPTGAVTFYDGSASLGTGTLASGTATFSTSSLAVGTHTITASYGGDTNDAISTSAPVTVTVSPAPTPTFTMSLAPTSGSVTGTGTSVSTVTITPVNGFSATVTFACSGLPARSVCAFAPPSVTPSGGAATTTLTITTTAAAANDVPLRPGQRSQLPLALAGGVIGLTLAATRRRQRNWHRRLYGLVALGLFASALAACGGKSTPSTSTPASPVTTAITVTATSGLISQTATYTLTTQ